MNRFANEVKAFFLTKIGIVLSIFVLGFFVNLILSNLVFTGNTGKDFYSIVDNLNLIFKFIFNLISGAVALFIFITIKVIWELFVEEYKEKLSDLNKD